jgi:flavin reductase (DIM6/NTAB) family NADH-FMN oxidoreductase RutF
MRKIEVAAGQAYRLLTPGCVVLVASVRDGKYNVMTAAWQMPVSVNPPLVAVAIAKRHLTAEYIRASGVFTVNVPGASLLPKVHYCGSVSGREADKFAESGLTAVPGRKVAAPLVAECLAGIECRLWNTYDGGDHYIFVGEIAAAAAAEGCFDKHWLLTESKSFVNHLGGPLYAAPGTVLTVSKEKDAFVVTREPLKKDSGG